VKRGERGFLELALYLNGRLGWLRRRLAARRLERDLGCRRQLASLQNLQEALQRRPQPAPAPSVWDSIQKRVPAERAEGQQLAAGSRRSPAGWPAIWPTLRAAFIFMLLLASLATLLRSLPPGITLAWSVAGETPGDFRVYRRPLVGSGAADEEAYLLVGRVPAKTAQQAYTFMDLRIEPGQAYLYRVDAVDPAGRLLARETIRGDGSQALPGQLLAVLGLCLLAVAAWQLRGVPAAGRKFAT